MASDKFPDTDDGFLFAASAFECEAEGKRLTGYGCRFRASMYRDELYERHGVHFPAQFGRAVSKRRSDYLAGRICAQRALAPLGVIGADIAIGPNREPVWPAGVVASISHAGDRAVCIASTDPDVVGLGIDIEGSLQPGMAADIRREVVDAAEEEAVQAHFPDFTLGLAVVFSAKESLYKALYPQVGRFFGFEAMRIVRIEAERIVFAATEELSATVASGAEYAAHYLVADGEVRTVACVRRPG
ncbi:4'-phosphopantetheinyl transferase [Lysobacter sp. Hz 25]|uniref:4'-phosphopantetheinyl transferase family protein n=1 Tax=Lysobacter sp. Hz 25 TaxID=3383698 RepID=UPI0038D364A4